MSLKVPVEIPLRYIAAIQNESFDKSLLGHFVVAAVKALPMQILPSPTNEQNGDDESMTDAILTPAPRSEDGESFTLVNTPRSGATTPKPTSVPEFQQEDPFYIDVCGIGRDGHSVGQFSLLVTRDMTVAELQDRLSRHFNIPINEQRLLLNGRQLKHEGTLASYSIKPASIVRLIRLSGICFEDSDLSFWVKLDQSPPSNLIPFHVGAYMMASEFGKTVLQHKYGVNVSGLDFDVLYRGRRIFPRDEPGHVDVSLTALGIRDGMVAELQIKRT